MINLVIYIYIIFSFLLIFLIILNQGKGSDLSIINQNNELLSSKDSNSILNKLILFLVLFLILLNFVISFYGNRIKSNDGLVVDLSKKFFIYR